MSQLRRGQELLSDDHSPENAVEQNHSVKDTRVKTWVPAVNTVQARRSALRVLDAGRQRRTPDTGTKEAPSMMAMMRDVIADDPNEDEQR